MLSELCDRGEKGLLFALRNSFCEMASWLLQSPIVHGALKPINVVVTPDGMCRLVRYEAMQVPGMEDLSEHWGDDTVAVIWQSASRCCVRLLSFIESVMVTACSIRRCSVHHCCR